jgi:hypothetical protein
MSRSTCFDVSFAKFPIKFKDGPPLIQTSSFFCKTGLSTRLPVDSAINKPVCSGTASQYWFVWMLVQVQKCVVMCCDVLCVCLYVCARTHEGIVWKCKSPLWDPVAVHFKWLGTLCGTWYPLRQISSHPNSAPWQRNWPKMKCRAEIGFQIESARHFVPWCNTLCQTVLQSMRNKCLHQLKL